MKTILEGKTNVLKLIGKQGIKNSVYRMMKYVISVQCKEGILLHNAITGQLVLLSNEEASTLNELPCAASNLNNQLVEGYFIVPVEYDERAMVVKLRNIMKRIFKKNGINNYTIFTTTNCNARCFYCYQYDYPHINLSKDTAARLVKYMVENRTKGRLNLSWFGGEPLVGIDRINQICSELNSIEIDFHSTMISNGFLFTDKIVQRAVNEWHLKSIQITLDGTEKVYNKTKAYASADGNPYKRVLNNIKMLLEAGVRVVVRLNIDKHNILELKTLLNELHEFFGEYDNFDIYSHVLFDGEGYKPIKRDAIQETELYRYKMELDLYMKTLGLAKYHFSLPSIKTNKCMADSTNSVVVYPDGNLYKCEHIDPDLVCGNTDIGINNLDSIKKSKVTTEFEECKSCPLYPTCIQLTVCPGLKEVNPNSCRNDILLAEQAILSYYENINKSKDHNFKESLDIANC